jgi:lipopolysaccharide export LptBFGC system permease protein LptF
MKDKIANITLLILQSALFGFLVWGFINILITFSVNDGLFTFLSVVLPSLIALIVVGFYLVKTILQTKKLFAKTVVIQTDK